MSAVPSTTIGELPRPWALVIGIPAESSIAAEIEAVFPTVRYIEQPDRVLQDDYDVAIVRGFLYGNELALHLNVIWFADNGTVPLQQPGEQWNPAAFPSWTNGKRAARFDLTPFAGEARLQALATNLANRANSTTYHVVSTSQRPQGIRPILLETGTQGVLAAAFDRTIPASSEVWCLPDQAFAEAGAWIRAAARHWEEQYPDRFPHLEWRDDPTWMDPHERTAAAQLGEHEHETLKIAERREEERARLAGVFEDAQRNAEAGLLRMLTTNAEELVEAATAALVGLGFGVTNSDQERPDSSKQEDLLVTDGAWVGLVEVKGYEKRNARENDLLQIEKAVRSYRRRTGSDPDHRWYLVNQSYSVPPPLRQQPLQGASESIQTFAELDGLIIDTRDLFRLSVDVALDVIDQVRARELLKSTTGVFAYPATAAPATPR